MNFRILASCLILHLAILSFAATLSAQENEAAPGTEGSSTGQDPATDDGETTTGDESLDSLKKQWSDLDAKLAEKAAAFKNASDAPQRDAIRVEYRTLIGEADALIEKIRTTALSEFESDTSNENIIKLLCGVRPGYGSISNR